VKVLGASIVNLLENINYKSDLLLRWFLLMSHKLTESPYNVLLLNTVLLYLVLMEDLTDPSYCLCIIEYVLSSHLVFSHNIAYCPDGLVLESAVGLAIEKKVDDVLEGS
jgi:hypothetical protein